MKTTEISCLCGAVKVSLPHFKSFPARFGGSDETVDW